MKGTSSNGSTAITMADVMKFKEMEWSDKEEANEFAWDAYSAVDPQPCVSGKIAEYQCKNVELKGFLRHQDTHSVTRKGNDIWGWTRYVTPENTAS
jgi:hypothetical protein